MKDMFVSERTVNPNNENNLKTRFQIGDEFKVLRINSSEVLTLTGLVRRVLISNEDKFCASTVTCESFSLRGYYFTVPISLLLF